MWHNCNYDKYFPFPIVSNVFNLRSVNGIVVLILKCQQVCGKGKFILVVVNVAFSGLATTQMLSECYEKQKIEVRVSVS